MNQSESDKILKIVELKKEKIKKLKIDSDLLDFYYGDPSGKFWSYWYENKTQSDFWFSKLKSIVNVKSIVHSQKKIEKYDCDVTELFFDDYKFSFAVSSSFRYAIDSLSYGDFYVLFNDEIVLEFRCCEDSESNLDVRHSFVSVEGFSDGQWVDKLVDFFDRTKNFQREVDENLNIEIKNSNVKVLRDKFKISDEELNSTNKSSISVSNVHKDESSASYEVGKGIAHFVKNNQVVLLCIAFLVLISVARM